MLIIDFQKSSYASMLILIGFIQQTFAIYYLLDFIIHHMDSTRDISLSD